MKYCVLNERGKFDAKIFSHYTDIVIPMLGHFIATHPAGCVLDINHQCKYRWIGHIVRHHSLLSDVTKGRTLDKATRGRTHNTDKCYVITQAQVTKQCKGKLDTKACG